MKPEDYQYLLSLPLVLHRSSASHTPPSSFLYPSRISSLTPAPHSLTLAVPSLSTHLVHAGLLPSDPTLPPSSPPPAWQLPSSSSLAPLNQTQRETLLLTSVKQNTLPYDVMNMRSIDEEGEVTKETIDGEGWSERWNEAMEECRVWGGAKKGEGEGFKKKGKNGGKKPKKPKHEIECQPISVIYVR